MKKTWWKQAVIYQIYPRSFMDSNGDGIGDIPGIISKLDYLKNLGVDAVWLSPIYASPNDDNGYDISDYYAIMDEFGTLDDFDRLVSELHKRDIKLITDLVVNHTSDEHEWFKEARSSRTNPKRDYYIWHRGNDGAPPNNWESYFGGSVWEWDPQTEEYYLHIFSRKQPDLNWNNPEVRKEIYKMMHWWIQKGVDGFRMDVINFLAKAPGFPNAPVKETDSQDTLVHAGPLYANQPGMHDILKEMNEEIFSKYDIVTIGECHFLSPEEGLKYAAEHRKELDLVFQFDFVHSRDGNHSAAMEQVKIWHDAFSGKAHNTITMNNHDSPRALSTFGDEKDYWKESAKALAILLFTLPGTPFMYQGEEIGMTNVHFTSIDQFRDIESVNKYKELKASGHTDEEIVSFLLGMSRDNARTPMQWDTSPYAGFSAVAPWIDVNDNYKAINAESQQNDPNSVFNFYKHLIALHKQNHVLAYGFHTPFETPHPHTYVYLREHRHKRALVLVNISSEEHSISLDKTAYDDFELAHHNYPNMQGSLPEVNLRPWEAMLFLS